MDSLSGMRVAIYARFSSDQQKDVSIDDQVNLCREHARRLGGRVPDDRVFADRATSGATKARPYFDALLKLVHTKAIDAIVTESADRLSRDLGDADRLWKLVEFKGVRLICVANGIDSIHENSRMHFRFMAVFADEFLRDLGKKTRRGQVGAMNRDHCTGGLPYGYKSKRVLLADGKEAFAIAKDRVQAAIVVRIFEMYKKGYSLLVIATRLNDDGVAPPRAKAKGRRAKFWRKSTLREMLGNRSYIGEWTYGKKRWRRDPETRKRRYIMQAPDEVIERLRPHLRIISHSLWCAVQDRRRAVYANYSGKSNGAPGRRTSHPFSGLLFCGVCGNRMVDGGGTSARYYRCSGATTGGICTNRAPVREDALIEAAFTELDRLVHLPALQAQLREKAARRIKDIKSDAGRELADLKREVSQVDRKVERFLAFIEATKPTDPTLDAVRTGLAEAVTRQRELKAKLAALQEHRPETRPPTIEELVNLAQDVHARLKEDPIAGREMLRNLLGDGTMKLTPNDDGTYQVESSLIWERLSWKTRKPRRGSGPAGVPEVVGNDGCAGRI